jgi:probable addiction module antidote protein
MKGYTAFDAADYLKDEEVIAEYLTAALEDPNPEVFLLAVRDVARARGMAELASNIGVGRESLYKALAPGAKPRYDTILKVMKGFGVQLLASPSVRTVKVRPARAATKKKAVRSPWVPNLMESDSRAFIWSSKTILLS